ncbi:putative DSBA-like thioredoxin domain-containing protein [Rosellinia necatrix]|uniref:Putative DSBA-like thioredoxin domain-containing protein n=1 Tax=Rosellinia necatrix TaxID=77044 RepID=A0A1W2TB61_ROSNE|nr:putative DSBA-like thioredoxin domain-containing protein [Rosellinia necatrix]
MTVIEIDIVSDFVCAWCYIGKRRLEGAIALYQKVYPGGKHDVFKLNWRPYYLGYNTFGHSVEKSELAKTKLADWSEEKKAAATKRVDQAGRAVGIHFKHGGLIGPHTRDAHRLVYLSRGKAPEITNTLVDGIFEAYHEQEKDISSLDVLREIALGAGLETAEVDMWLSSDNAAAGSVDEEAKAFREKVAGSGVPSYFVQGLDSLEGAQDADDLMEAFIKVKETKQGD